jgi:transcriptional regulator GlxA family with amidase domain
MDSRLNRIGDWEAEAALSGYRVSVLAQRLNITVRQLQRYFVEHHGVPPKIILQQFRIAKAQALLRQHLRIKEVASKVGFQHATHFSRALKRSNSRCSGQYVRSGSQMSDLGRQSNLSATPAKE